MKIDYHLFIAPFFALTMGFVVYRRLKRSIGFQKLNPFWMKFRMSALGLVGVMLIVGAFSKLSLFWFEGAGLSVGALLVFLAVKHSEIETRDDGLYFRTHVFIETTVIVLLLGRVGYRFYTLVHENQFENIWDPRQNMHFLLDPWTAGIFFILVTYYLGYFFAILSRRRKLLA
jgi:hypothetical protein